MTPTVYDLFERSDCAARFGWKFSSFAASSTRARVSAAMDTSLRSFSTNDTVGCDTPA